MIQRLAKYAPVKGACVLAITAALAGCNAGAQPPAAQASAAQPSATQPSAVPAYSRFTPPDFQLPQGAGCSGDVARWQAIQENDKQMGHVTADVYAQIQGEISQAASACQAGRNGEARAMVSASKHRHGYPA